MFRIPRMAVASFAAVMLVVQLAKASVMDQIPGEALFVIKVTNVKGASEKFAKFATDLGVAGMVPPMADPLGFAMQQLNIKNGVNQAGDFAFVFIDPDSTGGNPDQSLMVLVPVSDFQAFVGNYADAKTDGDVTSFTFPGSGHTSYAMKWGDYAALSPEKEVLSLKPVGMKTQAVGMRELQKDLVLVANFKALRAKLQPQLADGREKLATAIDEELGKQAPELEKFLPTIKIAANRFVDIAESFLRDADAATVAVNFVPEGLNVSVVSDFTDGSYLANCASSSKNSTASLTAGLPAGKYLFFGGGVVNAEHDLKIIEDIARPVLDELAKTNGPESAAVNKMYAHVVEYMKATKGQMFGLMAPQNEVGQGALIQAVNVYSGDSAAIKQAYIGITQTQGELMAAFGLPADQMKYVVTEKAKTVEGVSFDQVKSEIKLDANSPDAASAEQMMKMLYGPEGMNFYVAALDDKIMLQTFGLDDTMMAQAIAAAKSGKDAMGEIQQVKMVAAQLPSNKTAVMFIPIDEVANTALNVAKQFGFGANVQMQPDLPPLGISFGTEGTALRFDAHAPTPLIQQLIAAGFQVGMQMNQGNRRGGPGGL